MIHVEISQVVRDKGKEVFDVYTDFENRPRWSKTMTSVKVVSKVGNTFKTEVEGKALGRKFKVRETHILTPPEKVVTEAVLEDGTSSKVTVTFTEVPQGARMDWMGDTELKGVWSKILGPLAKRQIQKIDKRDLEEFAKYVEGISRR